MNEKEYNSHLFTQMDNKQSDEFFKKKAVNFPSSLNEKDASLNNTRRKLHHLQFKR